MANTIDIDVPTETCNVSACIAVAAEPGASPFLSILPAGPYRLGVQHDMGVTAYPGGVFAMDIRHAAPVQPVEFDVQPGNTDEPQPIRPDGPIPKPRERRWDRDRRDAGRWRRTAPGRG